MGRIGIRDDGNTKRLSKPINQPLGENIMLQRLKILVQAIRDAFSGPAARLNGITTTAKIHTTQSLSRLSASKRSLVIVGVIGATGYALYSHPPLQPIGRGEVGVRVNQLTGGVSEWRDGSVLVVPGLHEMRVFSLRDQTYRPTQLMRAQGSAPVQSVEGLSLGVDLSIRYALDATKRVGAR